MEFFSRWANIPAEDYVTIMTAPTDPIKASEHYNRALKVYNNEYVAVRRVWDRLPLVQWETTKAIGRDLPEWTDLREVLINFRKAIRKIKRMPKKVIPNAEVKSSEVPQ